jgi:hypothetical protein
VAYYSDIRHPEGKKPKLPIAFTTVEEVAARIVAEVEPAPGHAMTPEDRDDARQFARIVLSESRDVGQDGQVPATGHAIEVDGIVDAIEYVWGGWRKLILPGSQHGSRWPVGRWSSWPIASDRSSSMTP